MVSKTLQRDKLWAAQTPQIFQTYAIIANAYKELQTEVTDDAAAVEQIGYEVKLHLGDYNNIKVTTPEDLALAQIIAQNML